MGNGVLNCRRRLFEVAICDLKTLTGAPGSSAVCGRRRRRRPRSGRLWRSRRCRGWGGADLELDQGGAAQFRPVFEAAVLRGGVEGRLGGALAAAEQAEGPVLGADP